MSTPQRIPTDGGQSLGHNPFASLPTAGLPLAPKTSPPVSSSSSISSSIPEPSKSTPSRKSRGRVDIIREKAGRGGKTVTVVTNFVGIGLPEKAQLAKTIQRACGTGGTVKEGRIEIQGDHREEAARILTEAGFQPVFAGG